ncbi:NAD-dependent epimerase/dehydratase family protein [Candidatus Pelagibacter sp.]|nr:NAD-dependent epimerase/dehydratase family protein [Candidatus Pelagibacter sp.]MDC1070457.1 NAD-dependent epimerase/dehydratase family protein [Candidatus Pelagibacter sp.]
MHVFITGIAGFLGSNLADYYIAKGYKVSGCDNLIGGSLDNLNQQNINFFKGDCENLEFMTKIMKDVDVVCHAAAFAHEGLSVFSPTLICNNNLTGSVSVFTAAIKNKVKRIVYCSSMARYGDIKIPYTEDQTPNPVDPYGVSKLAAEKILKILCDVHGVEYNIAVPHNIIGPKQNYNDPYRNVAAIMVNLMIQNRRPVIYGDGEQKRTFSDVDDCVYCLDKLLLDPLVKSQVVNIGPDDEFTSINTLFSMLSNKLGFNQKPIYLEDRPTEVKFSTCSAEKAKKLLNYRNKITLDESIDKVIDFIKSKGPKEFTYDYDLEINNDLTPKSWKEKLF